MACKDKLVKNKGKDDRVEVTTVYALLYVRELTAPEPVNGAWLAKETDQHMHGMVNEVDAKLFECEQSQL